MGSETMQRHTDDIQSLSQSKSTLNEFLRMYIDNKQLLPQYSYARKDRCSQKYVVSNSLLPSEKGHIPNTTNILENVENFYHNLNERGNTVLFGRNETCVYMTLCTADNHRQNSQTQASAAINKCLQVHGDILKSVTFISSNVEADTGFNSGTSATKANCHNLISIDPSSISEDIPLYLLGLGTKKRNFRSIQYRETQEKVPWPKKSEVKKNEIDHENQLKTNQPQPSDNNQNQATDMGEKPFNTEIWCQTSCCKPQPCTDLVATVSHVKIKSAKACPVHAPKSCVNYPPNDDDKAPVIVTTGANPRRGVFEFVIRRLNGAPIAKNELILEWTPPASRPCGAPCPLPCFFPNTCRPVKCKTIVCRATPCKPFKCCMRTSKRPCGPMLPSCGPRPCGPRPCGPRPCGPRPCGPRPCDPRPCGSMPCGPTPCGVICPSKCYRPPCRPNPPRLCLPACRSSPPLLCPPLPCPPQPCPPLPCPPLPCSPLPCPSLPCPSRPCPSRPCPSRPCSPRPCRLPQPCLSPCGSPCYGSSCQSSPCCDYLCPTPCFRPCPVGKYRKLKKNRKPKIKKHRKYISPCLNRAECCPIVSCRSMPPGCGTCASCSSPCKLTKFPFKPRCCRSECTNCC